MATLPRRERPILDPTKEGDIREKLGELAGNLLALEINTILKTSMTATKMPAYAHALLDIAGDYDAKLATLGAEARSAREPPLPEGQREASFQEFNDLRERAKRRICQLEKKPGDPQEATIALPDDVLPDAAINMLSRILDNSDQLKGLFLALEAREGAQRFTRTDAPSIRLLPNEAVMLRKIWELGTEQIAIQTVVYLDGDVITRLGPDLLLPSKRPLIEIHNSAVRTSTDLWHTLIEVLGSFMNSIGQLVFGRRST